MATIKHICPKCNAAMEPGLVLDVAAKNPIQESVVEPHWVACSEGEVEKTAWPAGYIQNLGGRDRRPVITYRCVGCGFLESFAGPGIPS